VARPLPFCVPLLSIYATETSVSVCCTFCQITINSSYLPTSEDGTDSVPKHWHIKFRRRGITQKKAYNIQNMAKV
jgi:hypothetical protein